MGANKRIFSCAVTAEARPDRARASAERGPRKTSEPCGEEGVVQRVHDPPAGTGGADHRHRHRAALCCDFIGQGTIPAEADSRDHEIGRNIPLHPARIAHSDGAVAGNRFATGQAQPGLSVDVLEKLPIAVPNEEAEQQKIADCLSSLDELIVAQARKVNALKTHKKGLMQQLFPREGETQPRLRFPEFRGAKAWSVGKLGDIAENLDNRRIPITSGDRETGAVPYYGASGIVDYVKDFIFDEDLLCVSEDGANLLARTYPIAFSIS